MQAGLQLQSYHDWNRLRARDDGGNETIGGDGWLLRPLKNLVRACVREGHDRLEQMIHVTADRIIAPDDEKAAPQGG
ncbi:MAG: hypothetical protein ACLPLR_00310 [Terriglobales bacterium]|jgi:hypothetical protein